MTKFCCSFVHTIQPFNHKKWIKKSSMLIGIFQQWKIHIDEKQRVKSIWWTKLLFTSEKKLVHLFVRTSIDVICNKLIGEKIKKPVNTGFYGPLVSFATRTVGMTGFEPAAPSSRTKCATGLRYIPKNVQCKNR